MDRRIVIGLVAANCLLLLFWTFRPAYVAYKKEQALVESDRYAAEQMEGGGVMSAQQFIQSRKLERRIQETGRISDADLQWAVSAVQNSHATITNPKKSNAVFVLSGLRYLSREQVSAAQHEQIRTLCRSIVSDGRLDITDKLVASEVLTQIGALEDAKPFLQSARSSSEPAARDLAERMLTGRGL